ncbi:hypothetical protein D3C73_1488930 [compost metagenome]
MQGCKGRIHLEDIVFQDGGDACFFPGLHCDKPLHFQKLQRFPDRGTADSQGLRKLGIKQFLSRLQRSFDNPALELREGALLG